MYPDCCMFFCARSFSSFPHVLSELYKVWFWIFHPPFYDNDVTTATLPVSDEIIPLLESNHHHPSDSSLALNPDGSASAILHPNFLAAEPLLSGYAHPYGKRFGISLEIRTKWCKSRVISPPELILCYSIPKQSLRDATS